MASIVATGLVQSAPSPGQRVRVWFGPARRIGQTYHGIAVVRSVGREQQNGDAMLLECFVETEAELPDFVLTWTIHRWEPM